MKLKTILKTHQKFTDSSSLKGNLGDGYLIRHNSIYRNIRKAALSAKFKFTSDRFHDYDSLALTQLPAILSQKKIPYCNNVNALIEIEMLAPGKFELQDLPPLRSNHVFHEAAHSAAHGIIQTYLGKAPSPKGIKNERILALHTLMEEAFANACESLANLDAATEIHDEFLFKNAYVMETPATRKTFSAACEIFGRGIVFQVLFYSFLHANFLQTQNGMENLARVIRLSFAQEPERLKTIRMKDVRLLQKVFKTGLDLDPEFTVFTNQFCLKLLGIRSALPKLFDYSFLEPFEMNAEYLDCVTELTRVATSVSGST